MPRYDDRLDNVLDLMRSGEHSNSDTVFRHISDILLQEGTWMAPERRDDVVYHLADIYPKTTQSARMEVMDIAARVQDAAPELIAIAAADTSIAGTQLWDQVSLPREEWPAMLKRLPRSILGRLRARLNLADDTIIEIDREWRDRIKMPAYLPPSLSETLDALKNRQSARKDTAEAAKTALMDDQGANNSDILDLSETVSPPDDAIDDTGSLFVPFAEEDVHDPAQVEAPAHSNHNGAIGEDEPIDMTAVFDAASRQTEPPEAPDEPLEEDGMAELREAAQDIKAPGEVIDLSDHRRTDATDEAEQNTQQQDDEDAAFALQENPQVEDPKIQDILERLREFGSRSKRAAEREPESSDSVAEVATLYPETGPETGTDEASLDLEGIEQPDAGAASLFLPEQPEDAPLEGPAQQAQDNEAETADTGPGHPHGKDERKLSPLSVNGTTWVTNRFGSLIDYNTDQQTAFGHPLDALKGQILSSLFVAIDRNTLDKALNGRHAFRDMSLQSRKDKSTWMVSAVPVFDDIAGIFLGYRGTATNVAIAQKSETGAASISTPEPVKTLALDVEGLAHELKTPLNAIRGFAEMIETEQLGPASAFARDRSQKISREADQLNTVISDLLLPKMRKNRPSEPGRALGPMIEDALAPFSNHLTIDGLSELSNEIFAHISPELLRTLLEKTVNAGAQWTPASRDVKLCILRDDHRTVTVQAVLPGWMGGSSASELATLGKGPRLSYRHPLLSKSFKGRGLNAILSDVHDAGIRVFLRGAGRLEAALVIVLPVQEDAV